MAPGILVDETKQSSEVSSSKRSNDNAPRNIFPDGIRTSGQQPPLYEKLKSYEDFPKEITGATVWKAEDYQHNAEKWVHHFSDQEKAELSKAADEFIASGTPLTGMTKDNFPLETLGRLMTEIREDVINGKGFILMKGFPVNEWGVDKSAVAYIGLGTYLGYFVSQNGKGHILGHVKDLGDDPTQIHRVRIYRTNARQFFHCDTGDIVGLLCLHRALEGGESDIASVHHVYNALQQERPDVVKTLTEPNWYFDRKGEVSEGEDEWIKTSVLYIEPAGKGRVYCKWDPYFVRSLSRFSDAGRIPALSDAQLEAIQVLEDTVSSIFSAKSVLIIYVSACD